MGITDVYMLSKTKELVIWARKKIVADYRKRMQELFDACIHTASELAKPIKKETVNQLIQMGQDVFKALETLETGNTMAMKCIKCGSIGRCSTCGTEITLVSLTPDDGAAFV